MLDNRFKRGLQNFSTSNKTTRQVINYLGKKADILGISLPKYITNMKKVSQVKVEQFINRLLNQADKEIRKSEIEKIQKEAATNKLKNAIKLYNKKVDNITKQMYKTYTKTQVDFLTGKPVRVYSEEIMFDGSNGVFLEKMDYDNFEFSSKNDMDNFTKELIKTIKNMTFEKYDEELLVTSKINGLTNYYENTLSAFLDEFNDLKHGNEFNKIGERYKNLNKVQKNMYVQAYMNNMRDDYPVPEGQEEQDRFELNYLNKLLRIMSEIEGY